MESNNSKRHLFFGVIAICFGLLTLLTVGDTFEHGIVYFLLGVLGTIISVLGIFSGISFVFVKNRIAKKFFKDFCLVGIIYGIFSSLINPGDKEVFIGFVLIWIALLIMINMNSELKETKSINSNIKKGKYLKISLFSCSFFILVIALVFLIWMVNWEEKAGLYRVPNGAGLAYGSLNDEGSTFSVDVEGGFVYNIGNRDLFGIHNLKERRYEITIKLISNEARIKINSDSYATVRLNVINMDSKRNLIFLNGDEKRAIMGESIVDFWLEQAKGMGDEEISEMASSGKFILMEKGEFLDMKVDAKREIQVEILKIDETDYKRGPLNFYVVSDTHSGYNIFMPIIRDIISEDPDFIILNGDIVNNGYSLEYVVASSVIESLPVPVFTTTGNHDIWENGRKYYNSYFGQTYYYFDHKGTRFIFLDSSSGIIGNAQFEWLKSVLENSYGKKIVVFSHISPVDTVSGIFDDSERANKQMSHTISLKSESDYIMGLMDRYNVTAFIAGHSHVKGRVKIGKTEYISTGVLGGSILPGEDVSYLRAFESDGEIIFEQLDIDKDFVDENSIKAKTQSMRVFMIPFLISKSIRISLSVFLLIGFSLFMYFFKDRLFYNIK